MVFPQSALSYSTNILAMFNFNGIMRNVPWVYEDSEDPEQSAYPYP